MEREGELLGVHRQLGLLLGKVMVTKTHVIVICEQHLGRNSRGSGVAVGVVVREVLLLVAIHYQRRTMQDGLLKGLDRPRMLLCVPALALILQNIYWLVTVRVTGKGTIW
jgi:hypothetical protein